LVAGLTPLGTWLIRDVHRQSQEVSDTTCSIIAYLSITPLIEAAVRSCDIIYYIIYYIIRYINSLYYVLLHCNDSQLCDHVTSDDSQLCDHVTVDDSQLCDHVTVDDSQLCDHVTSDDSQLCDHIL